MKLYMDRASMEEGNFKAQWVGLSPIYPGFLPTLVITFGHKSTYEHTELNLSVEEARGLLEVLNKGLAQLGGQR